MLKVAFMLLSQRRSLRNKRPWWSLINLRLPSKLSALIQAERLPKMASLPWRVSSRENCLTRLRAPLLLANSYTCRLLVIIAVSTVQPALRTNALS